MKRKIGKKLTLNKETLHSLHETKLKEAAGGVSRMACSDGCTAYTGCGSCFETCVYINSGVCC